MRQERGGVAGVGRHAVVEQIEHAERAGGGRVVVVAVGAVVGDQVVAAAHVDPVAAQAGRQAPAIDFDLVLQVQAAAVLQAILVGQRIAWARHRLVIVGSEAVNRRRRPHGIEQLGVDQGVIPAADQGVLPVAGGEVADQAGVGRQRAQLFVDPHRVAVEYGAALLVWLQVLVGGIDLAVAQVLLEGESIVEDVLELVAQGPLALFEFVEVLIALPEVGQVIALLIEHRRGGGFPLLVLRQHGEAGVGVDLPGQRGRDQAHVVVQLFDVVFRVAIDTDYAKQQVTLLIQAPADIELTLLVVVVARLDLHFVLGQQARTLAHPVDHAAWADLAVEHR
ncbi:hypothetical protein D3C76_1054780 [compost metagenome]